MAFFSSGSDKEKLMILYSLKKAGIPLSREQIVGIMSENGLENYIDIAQHIMELEGNACLATVPTYRRQTIVLTSRGEEVVSLFAKTLPRSLRDGIDAYVERKLDDFRRENTSQAETRRTPPRLRSWRTAMRSSRSASSSLPRSIRASRSGSGTASTRNCTSKPSSR